MTGELPDASNGWRVRAWELHKRRGCDFYRAYDQVLVRYLVAGNPWPLLDLIHRLHRQPGQKVAQFIAAVTDGQSLLDGISELSGLPQTDFRGRLSHCKPQYQIHISERRGRGPPKPDDAFKRETRWRSLLGFSALAEGKRPPSAFWIDFANALFPDRYVRWKGQPFPFKAKLVRTDGGLGRPDDPELDTRDEALAAAVNAKIEGGSQYKAAIEEVRKEVEAQAKAERASGGSAIGLVRAGTIRTAYAQWRRRRRKP